MMEIIWLLLGLIVGVGAGVYYVQWKGRRRKQTAEAEAEGLILRAKNEAQRVEKEARNRSKDMESRLRRDVESELQRQKNQAIQKEKQLKDRERQIENQLRDQEKKVQDRKHDVEEQAQKVRILESRLKDQETSLQGRQEDLVKKLEGLSNISTEAAKKELVEAVRKEAELEGARLSLAIENDAKVEAEKKAKKIISLAISRYAGEYVTDRTVSVISLPNEEMKGKIIGREGRNIRTLESLCGVDLIIDETPEAVVISGFDPVRREVARLSLAKLMEDGRIHPSRIEEVVDKTKQDLFKSIKEDGEKACFDLGINGVDPEIVKLIGSLKYRTSYTQNNYSHSIETGFLAGMMAGELSNVHVPRLWSRE